MLWKIVAVVTLLAIALSCASAADDPFQKMDATASVLAMVAGQPVNHWRFTTADVPNGQSVGLDDSKWRTSDVVEFTWGDQPAAWLRSTVTVPAEIAGISVAGSSVTFRCGVDDDGVLYVNGKEVQKFHWADGRVVLTEHAKPGEKFDIAIKGINTGGPGRLLSATLEFGALEDIVGPAAETLAKYLHARAMYQLADPKRREPYLPIMTQAMAKVDLALLRSGKVQEFIASLKAAGSGLDRVDELTADITAHLVGHAHIDMNWLWLWPETIDVCKNTFTSACNLMQEFPDFRFGQSQAVTYLTMQKKHPEVFARIEDAIKRGQWDPIASTWTEGDNNMSSGEAIVRSILYGKRYMKQQLGVETQVAWEPDTFGHPWTLPQILAKSGLKYYYFMRANDRNGKPVFWWEGPDGSRVLAYCFDSYNSDISEGDVARDALRFAQATGLRDYMRVYGVGDHGGGPTRQMLETAKQLQTKTNYPKVEFSKASDYYAALLKSGKTFPVWKNELNTVFEGCYTTHADIKRWNRESENLIPCAEKFASAAAGTGLPYPLTDFTNSWRNTCFNQFHDLLCGSAIHGSYDYSRQLYQEATGQAKSALDKSLKTLASKINTNGGGIPIVVFNSLSWTRTDAVEVASPFTGQDANVKITDGRGRSWPAKSIGDKLYFTARDVPALGYKVFWANRTSTPVKSGVSASNGVLENQFFRVTVDRDRGTISGIYDKLGKRQVLAPKGEAALQILMEDPHGMSAWNIGRIVGSRDLTGNTEVVTTHGGPARATVTFDHQYDKSSFVQEVTLYDGVPRIDIRMTADWQEVGSNSKPSPMLKVAFPTSVQNGKATFEIPFGSIERPTDGAEVPAQKWIDLSGGGYGVSLLNNCKYGFSVDKNTLRATLLRASYDPDPTPDVGTHEMTLSLYPHKGDWRSASTTRRAYELNEPLVARVTDRHKGTLPPAKSFVSISEPNLIVTALKRAEDNDGWILRFYETDGRPCKASVSVSLPASAVVETDLMERLVGSKIALKQGRFDAKVGKYEIKTYKLLSR